MRIRSALLASFDKYLSHIAIIEDGRKCSYQELKNQSIAIANQILKVDSNSLIGIIGQKSIELYAGIVASQLAGKGYVPLSLDFPLERLLKIIDSSEVSTLLICPEADTLKKEILKNRPQLRLLELKFLNSNKDQETLLLNEQSMTPLDTTAYLLFTSGSTGEPKGIEVTEKNLISYLEYILDKYPILPTDRISQTFECTFDLSVHDIFSCFLSGATLYPLKPVDLIFPGAFIKKNLLTIWFSVPTLGWSVKKMNQLQVPYLNSLRRSYFCGEALSTELAQEWKRHSNAAVINLYGPTEATIAIMEHELKDSDSTPLVQLGEAFANGSHFWVRDLDTGDKISIGKGELMLTGPQLAKGYWKNPIQTKASYKLYHGLLSYHTGDLVDLQKGTISFLGRLDTQIKWRGYRIELSEIESQIQKACEPYRVAVLTIPYSSSSPEQLVAVIEGPQEKININTIQTSLKNTLPQYMLIEDFYFINEFPKNVSGKLDRKKLSDELFE